MEIKAVKEKDNKLVYSVLIDKPLWEQYESETVKQLGQKIKIHGYRPGKAPVATLKKYLDIKVLFEKTANKLTTKMLEWIQDQKEYIDKFSQLWGYEPEFSFESIDTNGYVFEIAFYLLSVIKNIDYKNLKLDEVKQTKIDQKIIDEAVANELKKQEMQIPKDKVVAKGDVVNIDFKGYIDNQAFEGGQATKYELLIGSKRFIDNFEDQLIGLKKGDTKDVFVKFPADYPSKEHANKEAKFEVKINQVSEIETPKYDDEFVKSLNIKNVATKKEYENFLKTSLEEKANIEFENQLKLAVKKALVEKYKKEVVIPERLARALANQKLVQFLSSLGVNVTNLDEATKQLAQFGLDINTLSTTITQEATDDLIVSTILKNLVKSEKIELDEKMFETKLESFAKLMQVTKKDILEDALATSVSKQETLVDQFFLRIVDFYKQNKQAAK